MEKVRRACGIMGSAYAGTVEDIRKKMSDNLCRCGAYAGIVAAIRSVDRDRREGWSDVRGFKYHKATSVEDANDLGRAGARIILAGGTTLVDLMRLAVDTPERLVDLFARPPPLRCPHCSSQMPPMPPGLSQTLALTVR